MKILKRKEMPLFILMCESQTDRQFQDVFGIDIVNRLFMHSMYEDGINDTFADVARKVFGDKFYNLDPKRLGKFNNLDELIDYMEWLLDMADKGKPLHNGEYLFQYFLPRFENNKFNWGLRGHPFLYAGIARKLSRVETKETSESTFIKMYYKAYEEITGRKLEPGEEFYVESFDPGLGGMSAGCVYSDWFITMLGILESRISQQDFFNEESDAENEDAKYIVMDFYGTDILYIEYRDHSSVKFLAKDKKWINGEHDLSDARVGFDESEPEGSPYRFGNHDCMYDLTEISKEEAERIAGCRINPMQIKNECLDRYKLVIKKENYEICDLQDWEDYAGPVDKKQWKDKRSAKEFARFILSGNGYIPIKLLCAICDYTKAYNYVLYPEFLTGFKKYGMGSRGPRHHDGLLVGSDIVVGIEAKADEALDKKYLSEYDSNKIRYKVISELIFGDEPENHTNIRYQLVSSAMGTLIEAAERKKDTAVLLIVSFISEEATTTEKLERNKKDIQAFKDALTKVAEDQYEVPFSKEHNIKFI